MKELHFKRNPGGTYQILFYVGNFFVPVEEDLIKELKRHTHDTPEDFLKIAIEKLGYNTYLKNAIQEALNEPNDRIAQAKTLMTEVQSL